MENKMRIKDLKTEAHVIPNHKGNSMELDFKHDFSKLKLIVDEVDPFDNKVYQGIDIFYLTDSDDNYLSHLEYSHIDQSKIMITTTFTKQKGFYQLMLRLILAKTPIKMIFGGYEQTESAVGAWKKTMNHHKKKVYNRVTNQVEEFIDSKENEYWVRDGTDPNRYKYCVGICESEWLSEGLKNGKEIMDHRRSCGRKSRTPHDILVRFYWLDPDDVDEMVEMYPTD